MPLLASGRPCLQATYDSSAISQVLPCVIKSGIPLGARPPMQSIDRCPESSEKRQSNVSWSVRSVALHCCALLLAVYAYERALAMQESGPYQQSCPAPRRQCGSPVSIGYNLPKPATATACDFRYITPVAYLRLLTGCSHNSGPSTLLIAQSLPGAGLHEQQAASSASTWVCGPIACHISHCLTAS